MYTRSLEFEALKIFWCFEDILTFLEFNGFCGYENTIQQFLTVNSLTINLSAKNNPHPKFQAKFSAGN